MTAHTTKVLIAVDDRPSSRQAVDEAFHFFGTEADYTVLSVGERAPVVAGGFGPGAMTAAIDLTTQLESAEAACRGVVEEAATHLPGSHVELETAFGHAGRTICSVAEDHASDVIVIGSRDSGFWDRLVEPSVTSHLVDHAPCPVLIIR